MGSGEPIDDGRINPWRCSGCGILVYNTELVDGRPIPAIGDKAGAPAAYYGSQEYPRLCSMCYGMLSIVSSRRYFVDIQAKSAAEIKRLSTND